MYDYYDYSSSVGTAVSAATLASIISTYSIFIIAFYVALVVAQWKIFVKAGEEGWKSIIPIYNVIILYKISGLSPWLLLLFLLIWVPVVGWIISVTLGGIIYYAIITIAIELGFPTNLKNLLYAILITIALCIPLIKKIFRKK